MDDFWRGTDALTRTWRLVDEQDLRKGGVKKSGFLVFLSVERVVPIGFRNSQVELWYNGIIAWLTTIDI